MTKMTYYKYFINVYNDEACDNEDRCGLGMARSWYEAIEQLEGWFGKESMNTITISWLSEEGTLLDMPVNENSKDFLEKFEETLTAYD